MCINLKQKVTLVSDYLNREGLIDLRGRSIKHATLVDTNSVVM